jgi:hypothetical protein
MNSTLFVKIENANTATAVDWYVVVVVSIDDNAATDMQAQLQIGEVNTSPIPQGKSPKFKSSLAKPTSSIS